MSGGAILSRDAESFLGTEPAPAPQKTRYGRGSAMANINRTHADNRALEKRTEAAELAAAEAWLADKTTPFARIVRNSERRRTWQTSSSTA